MSLYDMTGGDRIYCRPIPRLPEARISELKDIWNEMDSKKRRLEEKGALDNLPIAELLSLHGRTFKFYWIIKDKLIEIERGIKDEKSLKRYGEFKKLLEETEWV